MTNNENTDEAAEHIFLAAVDLPIADQGSFVDNECGSDLKLRQSVIDLLRANEHATGYFNNNVISENLQNSLPLTNSDLSGSSVGRFKLERLLGHGGMGSVYLANRNDDEFEMQAAIKLLPIGLQSRAFQDRFRKERQILAKLNHPNIASMIDGGVMKDGTPYFAMEYVKGQPLIEYCNENTLSIRERLSLFKQICSAISFAHSRLVVHRDIKPDNVLVTDQHTVKLLDFGIARLVDSGQDAKTSLTLNGLMTPAYASPEQLSGEPASTNCDIYSLGVLLFELLTNSRPYQITHSNISKIVSGQIHHTIPSLDTAIESGVRDSAKSAPQILDSELSTKFGTTFSKMHKQLSGELTLIVKKALAYNPDERYQTVAGLLNDIEAYLQSKPITAAKPTLSYIFKQFVKRNKAPVAIAALAGILAIGTTVISIAFGITSKRQSERIALERDRAEQLTNYLIGLFDVLDPRESGSTTLLASDLLKLAGENIEESFSEHELSKAALHIVIGRAYGNLQHHELSEEHFRTGIRLYEVDPLVDARTQALALIDFSTLLSDMGKFDESITNVEKAIALVEPAKVDSILLADAYSQYAAILAEAGDVISSIKAGRRSIAILGKETVLNRQALATSTNNLATALQRSGQYEQALKHFQKSAQLSEKIHGKFNADLGTNYSNISSSLLSLGRLDEAESAARTSLDIRIKVFGEKSTPTIGTYNSLGRIASERGEHLKAIQYFDNAMDITAANLGENHPHIPYILTNQCNSLVEHGRLGDANLAITRGLTLAAEFFDGPHLTKAKLLHCKAKILLMSSESTSAMGHLDQSIDMFNTLLPNDDPLIANALALKAEILFALGDEAKGNEILNRSREMLAKD